AGGDNNAYTTNDLTNYHCQLPAQNIETAFWLESDRMLSLAFSKKSLEVQRKVVCEEFKEHYINQPYGDAWHKMRELAFTTHPYRWMTIGKELSHVENAQLNDVKDFFFKHYRPVNAILLVAGNVKTDEVKRLAEKWFGDIPSGEKYVRSLPEEPVQTKARKQEVIADVPLDAFYKTWHMPHRLHPGYYAAELISDVLSGGGSSRLYQALVKEKKLFSNIDCYHFGSVDAGLMAVEGKLVKGVKMEAAEKAVNEEIEKMTAEKISEQELQKVKNKTESIITFEDMNLMSRAGSLAFYELLGDAELMNTELGKYHALQAEDLLHYSKEIFAEHNSNTLHYFAKN
ncbi:MAG TPA: pitrilysin family protein, partial [Chitinophagaceae bacterium]|nr:pitrilysin family protein [Chitinophagaceae bacterium]